MLSTKEELKHNNNIFYAFFNVNEFTENLVNNMVHSICLLDDVNILRNIIKIDNEYAKLEMCVFYRNWLFFQIIKRHTLFNNGQEKLLIIY